ncbi:MAG: PAS domain S-box protein [Chitinophagaceae bacterium]
MNRPTAFKTASEDYLSVIHKNSNLSGEELLYRQNPFIQTDLAFNITGWNSAAETLHGRPGAMGNYLFDLVNIEFIGSDLIELKTQLVASGSWSGEVFFKRFDGQKLHFKTTVTYLINENKQPVAIMIVSHNISDVKKKIEELAAAENKYEILLNTLPEGVVMMNPDGKISACNKRGAEILGLTEDEALGRVVASPNWEAVRKDGSPFPIAEFPAMVSLQTGFPQRNIIMGINKPEGLLAWLSINSQALIRTGEFEPYAVVISYSDITETIKTEKELRQSNERFYHVSKVTSDAIWDLDLETNEIYRSSAFSALSGYSSDEISRNLNWWFENVHPEDRERVQNKLKEHIQQQREKWEDEYRFKCADHTYKYLYDTGIILYKKGIPVRILGAIRDMTEQKKLEKQLLEQEVQKHQAITLATIAAQEQEKTTLSRELHDNVNQIIMSAKLYMESVKKMPEQSGVLIDKAIEYQMLALQEIRKLSKTLNTSNIKTVGLKDSVQDIVDNMKLLQELKVDFNYDRRVDLILTDEQKLMLFRIIQEQTSNILKYAAARKVVINISEANNFIHLYISDDGRGFDTTIKKDKGIGFINITGRAEALSGIVNILSSPGKGCSLDLKFAVN